MSLPIARQGTSVLLRVYLYDTVPTPRELYDPSGDVKLNLHNPAGDLILDAVEADRVSQGHYAYVYQLEDDAPVGAWTADWQTTNGAQVIKEPPFGAFAVVVSPA